MQIDNRGDFEDAVKALETIGFKLYVKDGNKLLTLDASQSLGGIAHLPFQLPKDDNYQIDIEKMKQVVSTLDGDIEVTSDEESLTFDDGNRSIRLRVRRWGGGPDINIEGVDTEVSGTVLGCDIGDISSEAASAKKIADVNEVNIDADGDTVTVEASSKVTSYTSDIDLDRQALPANATFDIGFLKKFARATPDDAELRIGDDKPLFAEGSYGDIDVKLMFAPRVEEG